jgi:hypothetical protein
LYTHSPEETDIALDFQQGRTQSVIQKPIAGRTQIWGDHCDA